MSSFIAADIAERIIADIGLPDEYMERIARIVDHRIECHHCENQHIHSTQPAGRGQHSTTTTITNE